MGKFGEREERDYMKVLLFDNWYLCTSAYDYRISKSVISETSGKETMKPIGHYTTLESLFNNLPNQILLNKSSATSIKELRENLVAIHSLIGDIKDQLEGK